MGADLSPGEQKLKSRRKRLWTIVLALGAAGFVPGFMLGFIQGDTLTDPQAVWPTWIVILLVASFLIAVPLGSWLLHRQMDELERGNQRKAAVIGSTALLMVYPVWLVLWMGDLAPEPIHWVLFLTFYIPFLISWIIYRLR